MKKQVPALLISLAMATMSFAQYDSSRLIKPAVNLAEQYRLQSRQWMKKSAILGGSGIALILIGAAIFPKDYDPFFFTNSSKTESQASVASVFMIAGSSLFISSIPCLITGFVKKHKANVILRTEKLSLSPHLNTSEWQLKTGISIGF